MRVSGENFGQMTEEFERNEKNRDVEGLDYVGESAGCATIDW